MTAAAGSSLRVAPFLNLTGPKDRSVTWISFSSSPKIIAALRCRVNAVSLRAGADVPDCNVLQPDQANEKICISGKKKNLWGELFANLIVWLLSTAVLCSQERDLDGISPLPGLICRSVG